MALSINPGSGYFQDLDWSLKDPQSLELQRRKFAIPDSLSNDFIDPSGFEQQTFLGASIRNFSTNAQYGDSSSTLNIELVNDEFNVSDRTPLGLGHDVYHNGEYDKFSPPQVGSPVFFQFGRKKSSVNNVYLKIYDDIYNYNYASSINADGQFHFSFGGILQSFTQNRSNGGNPTYSVQVTDPREILSNTSLILNNYTGTTYNNKNIYNLYGFLEYNPTLSLKEDLEAYYPISDEFRKIVPEQGSGNYYYSGKDLYAFDNSVLLNESFTAKDYDYNFITEDGFPAIFPITGTGYSRRCNQGMPYYRIKQSLEALLGLNGPLPQEYITAGFGGYINFRGFNYVVDLSGLKKVDDYYFFDFDQINLLDFCLEICDITSSDLFVSLLPIIDHPVCKRFYDWNKTQMEDNKAENIIAGIIRVDAIDRSFKPNYGAIKSYIDSLPNYGVHVENQDVGFELSNVTTDKFIVGAQEVDMYYFSANSDRDVLEERKARNSQSNLLDWYLVEQWKLETSLKQQILPYYGLLGNKALTIPKGFGAYQQILLDASSLYAFGVGDYYVATEMELRCALISFERWEEFIASYDNVYMESTEEDDQLEGVALQQTSPKNGAPPAVNLSNNYAVTVPRCVFPSNNNSYGEDGLPVNTCSPPYGYPLYYKRGTKLGVRALGLVDLQGRYTKIITSGAELIGADDAEFKEILKSEWEKFENLSSTNLSEAEKEYVKILRQAINGQLSKAQVIGLIEDLQNSMANAIKHFGKLAKKAKENAMKVYNFIKRVADECLGKKFLVKIPREVNLFYDKKIKLSRGNNYNNVVEFERGPFGFKPRSINYDSNYESTPSFSGLIDSEILRRRDSFPRADNCIDSFLTREQPNPQIFQGALNVNFNPLSDNYEFNYKPSKQGGFINFDLYANLNQQNKNLAVSQGLMPVDLTNFLQENNRLSAYVRFDHSEFLDFSSAGAEDYTQQKIEGGFFVPDISQTLDNTSASNNQFQSFPNVEDLKKNIYTQPPSIAFMKCDVDENFYMPPKTTLTNIGVHGRRVFDIGEYSKPRKLWDAERCEEVSSYKFYVAHFVPSDAITSSVQRIDFVRDNQSKVSTKNENLDSDHVYALITLPSRVVSNIDARFKDSTFQMTNAERLKHYLSMDVVRLPEFQRPAFRGASTNIVGGRKLAFDAEAVGNAALAYSKAMSSVDSVYPNLINIIFPSPVYPDLVALPLESKERCYGPWVSSKLDIQANIYDNIAGKIEFIKDEDISPWNYNGYDLMNAAGEMQAIFSNSLLLTSERGGFVIPDAPSGVYLGKFLAEKGPLVTSISVDISPQGLKTTYKMDLYTASFGKLQKQKQDMISNIGRERQKLKDEKNALIRKGMGKNQTNVNLNLLYRSLDRKTLIDYQVETYRGYQSDKPSDSIVMHSEPVVENVHTTQGNQSMANGTTRQSSGHRVTGSVQNEVDVIDSLGYQPDRLGANIYYDNTASSSTNEMYSPMSNEYLHPNMPYRQPVPQENSFVPDYILDSEEFGQQPDHSIWDQ